MHREERKQKMTRRDVLVVLGLFAVSHALYALLGLRFDASTFPGYMQFIEADLLADRLLESLWYYHAGPPLLNLLAGVGIKLFGAAAPWFFGVSFHVLGLLVALCVYSLTLKLSGARAAACIATGLLVFSPAFVLYENWLMYTFPAVALLVIATSLLYRYLETLQTKWVAAFFGVLAALLLTRSLFHLAWMVLIAALLAVVVRNRWRQVLFAATLPVLLVGFWYGKNYYLFGTFSASSWMGLGLSNITTLMVPQNFLVPLVRRQELSSYALVSRYENIELLFATATPRTGIAVLDRVGKSTGDFNFNNIRVPEFSAQYAADGVKVMRTFPGAYVQGLWISNRLFFSPSNMNLYFTAANRAAVEPMEMLFNPLLYGASPTPGVLQQPHFGLPSRYVLEVNTGIPLIALWALVLGYGYAQVRRQILAPQPGESPRTIVIAFIGITILYVYAVATALELGENYRYRFLTEPLFMVLTATAAADLVRKVRAAMARRSLSAQPAADSSRTSAAPADPASD